MTKLEIITKAQLYLDDTSELSTQEFSDLFDKFYNIFNSSHTWEGTKAEGTATTSTSVSYVALPSDFLYLTANHNHTDQSYEAGRPVVFRGANYSPYYVVSWSDRRQYRDNEGYAYIDFPNSRLEFTKTPTIAEAVEFDYHAQQAALADGVEPWFPAEFHDWIYHRMVSDDQMIQQSPKSKSYANANRAAAEEILNNAKWWNSQLVQI
jgi:hypothetical protein